MKACAKCKKLLKREFFSKNLKYEDGLDLWCKLCWSKYRKKYYQKNLLENRKKNNSRRKRRVAWLANLKKDKPCLDCGQIYEPFCMDFDHIHDKKKSISRMVLENYSKKEILEEISKCDLICILCHNKRTQERLDGKAQYRPHVKRNIEIINNLKNVPCSICKSIYPEYNMHFDHINPKNKQRNISQLKSASVERLMAEIDKCQVLCALCHRRKSILEQRTGRYSKRKIVKKKKMFFDSLKKECSCCGEILEFEHFCKSSRSASGYQSWCKHCTNEFKKRKRKLKSS